jgi:hypothetical protein
VRSPLAIRIHAANHDAGLSSIHASRGACSVTTAESARYRGTSMYEP